MKVLFLANIPAPYRVDFFNELGKYCDLTVTFEGRKASDRNEKWYGEVAKNFQAKFLNGVRTGNDNFFCVGIIRVLQQTWDKIIVGVYYTPTSMLAIEYLRIKNIPFYISADGGFIKKDSWLKHNIKRHFISAAKWWLSTSELTTDYLCHYGAKKESCYLYPFTSITEKDLVNAGALTKMYKAELKARLDIKEKYVVLTVGQFIYRKGIDVLLRAAKGFSNNIGVYIVGDNPLPEYIKLKQQLGLNQVHFIGFKKKNELANYYACADIFVLPTREDIWGLVINEAMAFGLPIVTTDRCIAGNALVENDINGYIVPINYSDALADKINNIINSPDKLIAFGLKSREKIEEYTIEKMAAKHLTILKET